MKELKFETSKGKFLIVDDTNGIGKFIPYDLVTKIGYIKNLTEEQASEIVDIKPDILEIDGSITKTYRNYLYHNIQAMHIWKNSAIESLHSLIKSKGIHLFENPYEDQFSIQSLDGSQRHSKNIEEAEAKTFYNPYLFKKI